MEGQEIHGLKLDKLELRNKFGMLFQQYSVIRHETALENFVMAPIHVLNKGAPEVGERAGGLI